MFDKFSSSDIALIAAVISPVVVVIINTLHQSHKDKTEFYFRHQCNVIESYLKALGEYVYNEHSQDSAKAYGIAHAEIYMYIPKSLWFKIDNMDTLLNKVRTATFSQHQSILSEARVMYEELCKTLSPLSRHPNWIVRKWRQYKLDKTFSNLPPNK